MDAGKTVTGPGIEQRSEPLILGEDDIAPVRAGYRSATPSTVRRPSRTGVAGMLTFGFGIGLGIGASVFLIMMVFGNPLAQPVATDAPYVIEAPSTSTPGLAAADGNSVAPGPAERTSSQLNASLAPAPEVRDLVPAMPSQIELTSAEFRGPGPVEQMTSVARHAPSFFLPAPPKAHSPGTMSSKSLSLADPPPHGSASIAFADPDFAGLLVQDGSNRAADRAPSSRLSWEPLQDRLSETTAATVSTLPVSRDTTARLPSGAPALTQPEDVSTLISKEDMSALGQRSLTLATPDTGESLPSRLQPSAVSTPSDLRIPGAEVFSVHVHAPSRTSSEKIDHVAETVRGTGMSLRPINRVGFNVSETHVRFYYDDDAPAAAEVAERLGVRARDFSSFRPSPKIGSIEIYVAGTGVSAPPKASMQSMQTPRRESLIARLFNRIPRRTSN